MPTSLKILAPAKLNLALDVLEKTASGFHEIQTIFQEIPELHDEIEIITTKEPDHTSIANPPPNPDKASAIPLSENLAHRALLLVKKTYKITDRNAQIVITKNIPLNSGLGGGSSNAAAVLLGLNELWNLHISTQELLILAAKLGNDVPFFIVGGTALGTNFGEKITQLKPIQRINFSINEKSSENPSKTKSAYQNLDLSKCAKNLDKTTKLLAAIESQNPPEILKNLHNDFEQLFKTPKNHHLSGSGPSTFLAT